MSRAHFEHPALELVLSLVNPSNHSPFSPFGGCLPAEAKNIIQISQLGEPIQRCTNRIKGVPPAQCFCDDVMRADQLHDCTNRSSRDDSGTVDRRLKQDMLSPE